MRKPIDEIADKLADEVRSDPSGAKSLAHLLVVVPTAQSGRRLRLKLAARFGALIPPEIRLPQQLLVDEGAEIAGRTDELVAFQEALGEKGSLDIAAQFSDIRGILGGNALSFADVANRIGGILTDETADFEIERWKGFAELETRYLAALAKRGKTDRIVAMKSVIADPPHLEGVEKVVIAYVLDPIPAMWQILETLKSRDKIEVKEIGPTTSQTSQTLQTSFPLEHHWGQAQFTLGNRQSCASPSSCRAQAPLRQSGNQNNFPKRFGRTGKIKFSFLDSK